MSARASAALVLAAGLAVAAALVLVLPLLVDRLLPANAAAPAVDTGFVLAVFGGLLAAGAIGGALSGVNPFAPGCRPGAMLAAGGFVGLFGVTLATAIAALAGTLDVAGAGAGDALLLWGAAVVLIQAGAEEVYFRGWLQPVAARAWGIAPGVVLTSVLFTLVHAVGGARSPLSFVNLFLGGLLFGLIAAIGRGIAGAVAAHAGWNGAEQLVLGLDPNPGVGGFGAAMNFDLVGSDEGLNASLAMTAVLLMLLLPAALTFRRSARAC